MENKKGRGERRGGKRDREGGGGTKMGRVFWNDVSIKITSFYGKIYYFYV